MPDEIVEAGWPYPTRKPGTALAEELLVGGEPFEIDAVTAEAIGASRLFRVMRDPKGRIVATWDEGRWWTPDESRRKRRT